MDSTEEAIKKTEGPCIILAGAGTGKTHTIVEKIKYLISKKIFDPEKIVCITFSNEAANSLQARIHRILSLESKKPIIKTFHSFSSDLLRSYGERIGINKDFKILDTNEAKVILHKNLKIPAINCHKYIAAIGTAKDLGITLEELEKYIELKKQEYNNIDLENKLEMLQFEFQTMHLTRKKDAGIKEQIKKLRELINKIKFLKAWRAYEKLKEKRIYQDYSDLNKNALILMKKFPEIANHYDYIIVDEFQDTNKIQLELLFALTPHKKITVVGDINQSIYRFRGAYNNNYKEFRDFFGVKDKEIYNLNKSYRSSNKILRLAHDLISNNYEKKEENFEVKNAWNKEGENIQVYELNNAREEARKVAEIVEDEIKKGRDINKICVMVRTHQYGRIIRQALNSKKIPYCAVGKDSLLKQQSVKTIINYLTILDKLNSHGRGSSQHWWELIYNLILPKEDIIKIGRYLKDKEREDSSAEKILKEVVNLDLSQQSKLALKILTERINLMFNSPVKDFPNIIKEIISLSGLMNEDNKEALMNLNKFYELSANHSVLHEPDISSFLHYLDILKELNIEIEASEIESNGVRLMTSHATKGLEYDIVIITNMAQKRFPIEKLNNNSLLPTELMPEFRNIQEADIDYFIYEYERKQNLFEERRLCYVGFTRAREKLVLTYAKRYGDREHYPSQFLNEIIYKDNKNISFFVDAEDKYQIQILENKENIAENSEISIKPKEIVFSPSALLLFTECQKRYEYKYLYNMPEEKTLNWEALKLGSFIHLVLEKGVKNKFSTLKEFIDCATELQMQEDWQNVDGNEIERLIKVFYERNKNKYNEKSKTELRLNAEIDGIKFTGLADRIDYLPDGIEIIDYKTGATQILVKHRNWQLGFYALAASPLGKVKKLTLDMLKLEKPVEFEVDNEGNAKSLYAKKAEFNINQIKEEIVETARQIINAHHLGFIPCPLEKNCEFCNEYLYKI